MICKFCREETELISAHIIPKSFYDIKDNNFSLKIITDMDGHFPKRSQTGVYDKEILCKKCDNNFGLLDQYATENFLRAKNVAELRDGNVAIARSYKDTEQSKIFDFALSILLRASWSKTVFFHRVMLGPYQELLENYFRNEEELSSAVDIIVAEYDEKVPLMDPHRTRLDGVNFWSLYANRFIFYIKVDSKKIPEDFCGTSIRTSPSLLTIVRQWRGSKQREVMQAVARRVNEKYGLVPRKSSPQYG
ncbi:MAG: hypothetical protein AAFX54_03785 [Pseudomonadota bacterium]